MTSQVIVYGAGGHARVALDVLRLCGFSVLACLAPKAGRDIAGVPVFGEDVGLELAASRGCDRAFVAIGDNVVRRRVAMNARKLGFEVISAVSPHAYVASDVQVGSGSLIVHGAIINSSSRIGEDVIVNTGATVDHDNDIGHGTHIAPGCHLAGNVTVGENVLIGVGTVVIPGIAVGDDAVVGAGSVVVRSVAAKARVWGNPAIERGELMW